MVVLQAMELLKMKEITSPPANAPEMEHLSMKEKEEFFQNICTQIVNELWHELDVNALMRQESEPVSYPYCCGLDLDEPMIGCEMREACDNHEWFHYRCRGIHEENIPEIFLCSQACKDKWERHLQDGYKYCFCQKDRHYGNTLVECAAKRKCINRRIYHVACVDLDEMHVPDLWFCSTTCNNESTIRSKGCGRKKMSIIVYEGKKNDHKKAYCRYVSVIATYHIC